MSYYVIFLLAFASYALAGETEYPSHISELTVEGKNIGLTVTILCPVRDALQLNGIPRWYKILQQGSSKEIHSNSHYYVTETGELQIKKFSGKDIGTYECRRLEGDEDIVGYVIVRIQKQKRLSESTSNEEVDSEDDNSEQEKKVDPSAPRTEKLYTNLPEVPYQYDDGKNLSTAVTLTVVCVGILIVFLLVDFLLYKYKNLGITRCLVDNFEGDPEKSKHIVK